MRLLHLLVAAAAAAFETTVAITAALAVEATATTHSRAVQELPVKVLAAEMAAQTAAAAAAVLDQWARTPAAPKTAALVFRPRLQGLLSEELEAAAAVRLLAILRGRLLMAAETATTGIKQLKAEPPTRVVVAAALMAPAVSVVQGGLA